MHNRFLKAILLAGIFCLVATSSAFAFENVKVSLGVKSWFSQWDTFTAGQNSNLELKGAEEIVIIPSATVKVKDFFITSSYWQQSGFTFDPAHFYWFNGDSTSPWITEDTYSVKADRSEFDVTLGYYIIPQVALTLGYKDIQVDGDVTWTWYDRYDALGFDPTIQWGGYQGSIKDSFSGPFIGANFAAAFNSHFAGYGSFAYGIFKEEFDTYWGPTYTDDSATYISSELGMAYIPARWMNVSLAYRFQSIESAAKSETTLGGSTGEDRMRGIMLGVNFSF